MELCSREDCWVCTQSPTSVGNKENHEFISMDTTCWETYALIHIGMILSNLGLNPHGFVFRHLPKDIIPIGYFPCL